MSIGLRDPLVRCGLAGRFVVTGQEAAAAGADEGRWGSLPRCIRIYAHWGGWGDEAAFKGSEDRGPGAAPERQGRPRPNIWTEQKGHPSQPAGRRGSPLLK
jgi:hypothetical protein